MSWQDIIKKENMSQAVGLIKRAVHNTMELPHDAYSWEKPKIIEDNLGYVEIGLKAIEKGIKEAKESGKSESSGYSFTIKGRINAFGGGPLVAVERDDKKTIIQFRTHFDDYTSE